MRLPQLPQDKANHFIYGFVIYVLANIFVNPYYSLSIVAIFGIGREIVQKITKKGNTEIMDAVWTIVPSIILFLVMLFSPQTKAQSAIITAGNNIETFGEIFPSMQTFDTIVQVSLGVPKYELPKVEPKKEITKKKSFIQSVIEFFKRLINKNK